MYILLKLSQKKRQELKALTFLINFFNHLKNVIKNHRISWKHTAPLPTHPPPPKKRQSYISK